MALEIGGTEKKNLELNLYVVQIIRLQEKHKYGPSDIIARGR